MSDFYGHKQPLSYGGKAVDSILGRDRLHEEMMRQGSEELATRIYELVGQRTGRVRQLIARNDAARADIKAGRTPKHVREKHGLSVTAYEQLASQARAG